MVLLLAACAGNIQPARQLDDAVLASQVREALQSDRALQLYNITVNARAGIITLIGVVGTRAERDRATQIARSVAGVLDVENLLSTR